MNPELATVGLVCSLGSDLATVRERLFSPGASRLEPHLLRTTSVTVPVGRVHEPLPDLPAELAVYECRNHRLAAAAYAQIAGTVAAYVKKVGAHRVAVVLGSSTAGLDATELAYEAWKTTGHLPERYNYKKQHAMGSVSSFVADLGGLRGPAYTLSTACTSGAKALISARDLLRQNVCDVVICGGVDTLCHLTLNGFEALGALARTQCLPMSSNRTGLNIGEGAAFFVMTRDTGGICLSGVGESTDAHHMSAPHPEGLGAEACMREALADAGLDPQAIEYLNLHGTATPQNDAMEALAVQRVLGQVPCSSTKPLVGHCLGAAGAIEAAFCWLSLAGDGPQIVLPPHLWDGQPDPALPPLNLVAPGSTLPRRDRHFFMSCSYAFGGNNCAIILERAAGGSK